MTEKIIVSILFGISFLTFVLSIRSFKEKGFLLNNAYIFASKTDRAKMNKKPHYRQTAVVLFLIGILFLLLGFASLLDAAWITYTAGGVILILLVYAIASSIAIEKREKQR